MGMLDWFPNPFRRSAPAPTRDPWDILKRPLDVEKLKTAVPIPAFLPYFDEQQTAGETLAMRFAYRFMLADPFVKSALLGKLLSVMSTELQVRPPKKFKNDPRHQMIAEFVEWNLTDGLAGGVPSLCWAILSGGCIDGLSVSEKVWDVEDTGQWRGKRVLSDLKPKDVNQDLVVNIDEFKNITSIRGLRYNGGEEFDVHDFVIYAHLPLFGNPTGMSDFRAAYGAYWIRDTVKKLRGMGAERYAFPTVIGEYPEASKKQALDLALSKMRSQTWATVPAGVKITVLDLAGSGPDKLQNLDRDLREEIVTGIQGSIAQTMMGGENQQRGNSETQETKGNLFGWHLSAAVVHLLNARKNGLIRDLVDRNFADVQEYPKAIFGGVDEGEAKESLDIDKGLKEMGYEPADIEEMQERYGRKLVKVQQPGGGVGPDGQPLPPGAGPTPPGAPPTPGAEPPAVPPEVGPEVAGEPQEGPADDLGDPAERADAMADIVGGSLGGDAGEAAPSNSEVDTSDNEVAPSDAGADDTAERADLMADILGGAFSPNRSNKLAERSLSRRPADLTRIFAEWDESKHPRGDGGRFGHGTVSTNSAGMRVRRDEAGTPIKVHDTPADAKHTEEEHFDTAKRPGFLTAGAASDDLPSGIQVPEDKKIKGDMEPRPGLAFRTHSSGESDEARAIDWDDPRKREGVRLWDQVYHQYTDYHRDLCDQLEGRVNETIESLREGDVDPVEAADTMSKVCDEFRSHLEHSKAELQGWVETAVSHEHGSGAAAAKRDDIKSDVANAFAKDNGLQKAADLTQELFSNLIEETEGGDRSIDDVLDSYEADIEQVTDALSEAASNTSVAVDETKQNTGELLEKEAEERRSGFENEASDLASALDDLDLDEAAAKATEFNRRADEAGEPQVHVYFDEDNEWHVIDDSEEELEPDDVGVEKDEEGDDDDA